MSKPRLGPCIYRALDGVSDYAAIITQLEGGSDVSLTCFPPNGAPTFYTRVRFDSEATAITVKRGTCWLEK